MNYQYKSFDLRKALTCHASVQTTVLRPPNAVTRTENSPVPIINAQTGPPVIKDKLYKNIFINYYNSHLIFPACCKFILICVIRYDKPLRCYDKEIFYFLF